MVKRKNVSIATTIGGILTANRAMSFTLGQRISDLLSAHPANATANILDDLQASHQDGNMVVNTYLPVAVGAGISKLMNATLTQRKGFNVGKFRFKM